MPWASPDAPSIQLGCLKAHLDRLRPRVDCRAYSAFFSILQDLKGSAFDAFHWSAATWGEYLYQALYLRRFGPERARGRRAFLRLLAALRDPPARPPAAAVLDRLEHATCRYLESGMGPALIARGLNLVGFTVNYDQMYASLYAAEHLRRCFPDRRFLFVYGGCTPSFPGVYRLLRRLRVPGLVVVGEGERKLELLVRRLEAAHPSQADDPATVVAGLDPGVIRIGDDVDLGPSDDARHARQFEDLGELPEPDYDEYFATLRRACDGRRTFEAYRARTTLLLEGTRGCFGRCDFCALNRAWRGFRKRSADEVLRLSLSLTRRYRTVHLQFADNVCDSWAEGYARRMVAAGLHQRSFMELRSHHPERFWALLALAGMEHVQIGIEAISTPLLQAMGKHAAAVQNLAAHKFLSELGIHTASNLMTHHPASTLADVRETRRILRHIPHFAPFQLTKFRLMAGSPLYERLTPAERTALRPTRLARLTRAAAPFACDFIYELPPALYPGRRVMRAWTGFRQEYERSLMRYRNQQPRLEVIRVAPDTLHITDTRGSELCCSQIVDDEARVYDACHAGLRLDQVVRATGLATPIVQTALDRLARARLMLRVDDSWLSLATRPRDELLRNLPPPAAKGASAAVPDSPPTRLALAP
ncbi:MAG TPA: radical SAM protein [Anaeromyxobacter sp.]|nr:radical SAM protein [Anaeromyxobacter sp.]